MIEKPTLQTEAEPEVLDRISGRVIYVLLVMVVLQLTYPFSLQGSWQNVVYLSFYVALLAISYATLTTLGYGEISPVSPWAQSIASLEAMLGLLYIAIILGRMASRYGTPTK